MGGLALKRREASDWHRVAPGQLSGTHTQERDQIGRVTERIRDRRAAVERERGVETPVDLGDQHPAGGDTSAVELGQSLETIGVGRGGEPENDARLGLISHINHQTSIAGL